MLQAAVDAGAELDQLYELAKESTNWLGFVIMLDIGWGDWSDVSVTRGEK